MPRPKPPVAAKTLPERVTLNHIAEAVGLPKMTVSLALRNVPGRVSEATRKRILAVANRLGYRPNMMAQAMVNGRSYNIGVSVRPIGDFDGRILNGIHSGLVGEGWLPILHYQQDVTRVHNTSIEAEQEIIHRLLDRRVDGLILLPSDAHVANTHFKALWERNIPLVTVDHQIPGIKADFVGTDDHEGGRQAAMHLLALGHRQIAQLAGMSRFTAYTDRRIGFDAALKAAGIRVRTTELTEATADAPAAAIRALLTANPRPSALFMAADFYAPLIYAICAELGLRIPQDLSVIGYADLSLASAIQPGLTTIAQNPHAIGVQAARQVVARCRGTSEPDQVRIRLMPSLVVRASTAQWNGR